MMFHKLALGLKKDGLFPTIRRAIRFLWSYRPVDVRILRPRRLFRTAARFEHQTKFVSFDIAPGSIVLDIGSGGEPFPLATILSDRYPDSSPSRFGPLAHDDRPFLVLDVNHLPFRDKSVDFIYCAHVLEVLDDPAQACSELNRVGRRGYIEVPTFAKDVLFNQAHVQKWYVVKLNNTLYFFEYDARQKQGVRSSAWRDLIYGPHEHPMQQFLYDNRDLFDVMFMWDDHFLYQVFRLESTENAIPIAK